MQEITTFEYFGTTTFCIYKVIRTHIKRRFRRPFILGQFCNLTSDYIITNDTKFKTVDECEKWVKGVLQRIERGEL